MCFFSLKYKLSFISCYRNNERIQTQTNIFHLLNKFLLQSIEEKTTLNFFEFC